MSRVEVPGSEPTAPRYGEASLTEVTPSILSALGVAASPNTLAVEAAGAVCLLVIDGLGWVQLRDHPDQAPFLNALATRGRAITTGFPSTTVASLGSIGTGLPPGRHGLVGYTLGLPGYERPVNLLAWGFLDGGIQVDLRAELPPEDFQPERTAFERAADTGLPVTVLGARELGGSGMTRAALRGGTFTAVYSMGDVAAMVLAALRAPRGALVYAYHPNLDVTGHIRGVDSESWALELAAVDRLAETIAERLPGGAMLAVTGDHGMVDVAEDRKVDLAGRPELLDGVRQVAGEPRARYVYAIPGAEADVLAAWRDSLGDAMWVRSRDQAIGAGWFGPVVPDRIRPRIGDVVAAAREPMGVFRRDLEGLLFRLIGHHGSLTPAELLVPFLTTKK